MSEQAEGTEERLDWDEAVTHPKTANGFVLVVRGISRVPMEVRLRPLPIGIAPEDYQGVEVLGRTGDGTIEIETPWTVEIDTGELLHGRKGFVLIGATKREYFPLKGS